MAYANQAAMEADRWKVVLADPSVGYRAETVYDAGQGAKVRSQYGATMAQLLGAADEFNVHVTRRGKDSGRRA